VCDENAGSRADCCGEDRDILRVGKLASPFAIVRCGTADLDGHPAEKLLEKRRGPGELCSQIPPDFLHGRLGQHQAKQPELAENQNRVTGTRARQEAGNQDVRIDANE
jgi:hypothetical protein